MSHSWRMPVLLAASLLVAPILCAQQEERLRLDELMHKAVQLSPGLQSARLKAEALRHRIPQAQALPDPAVSVGWAGNIEPFSVMSNDPSSGRSISVSEQFPLASKRKLQGQIAAQDVESAVNEVEAERRRILFEASNAFYEYLYSTRALEIVKSNRTLLDEVAEVATGQYRAGKGMLADLVRAQMMVTAQSEKQIAMEHDRSEAQARINALLLQNPDEPIAPPEAVDLLQMPVLDDALYQKAQELDVALRSAVIDANRNHLVGALADRQQRPDLNVGYMFEQRADQSVMHGVTLGITLPLFTKDRQKQAIAEAAVMEHSSRQTQQERAYAVRLDLRKQYLAADAASRLVELYRSTLLPQARMAVESALAAYRTGKGDMQSVLVGMNAVLDAELECERQIANQQSAVAAIEIMTANHRDDASQNAVPGLEKQ